MSFQNLMEGLDDGPAEYSHFALSRKLPRLHQEWLFDKKLFKKICMWNNMICNNELL